MIRLWSRVTWSYTEMHITLTNDSHASGETVNLTLIGPPETVETDSVPEKTRGGLNQGPVTTARLPQQVTVHTDDDEMSQPIGCGLCGI